MLLLAFDEKQQRLIITPFNRAGDTRLREAHVIDGDGKVKTGKAFVKPEDRNYGLAWLYKAQNHPEGIIAALTAELLDLVMMEDKEEAVMKIIEVMHVSPI